MKENIMVIGGTGKTGRRIVSRLQDQGYPVRIGSRSGTPPFDWQQPDTWAAALSGMNKAYISYQPDLAMPGALETIEKLTQVAKDQGLEHLVLLSGKGEKEAELCEQVIIHSGLGHTILRASWFMQNFSESFFLDAILAGQVALPLPQSAVPYVDAEDIADVAVAALTQPGHNGQVYELTGPEQLTFAALTKQIAIATDRKIDFTSISQSAYNHLLEQAKVPAEYRWLINYLFTEVLDNPENNRVSSDIERVLGRPPRSFHDYAQTTAATGVWHAKAVITS